jgi:hypothetical protein
MMYYLFDNIATLAEGNCAPIASNGGKDTELGKLRKGHNDMAESLGRRDLARALTDTFKFGFEKCLLLDLLYPDICVSL